MHKLQLEIKKDDLPLISRSKRSLEKNFSLTSASHVSKASWLALCLYVLGQVADAKALLESFVHDVESVDGRRDLWGSNGDAILLLAYIYRNEGKLEKEVSLVEIIINDDIWTDRTTRGNLLREEFSYHTERMEHYPSETHKYRCEILGERFFSFLYFLELMPTYKHELDSGEVSKISELIGEITGLLSNELSN